MDQRQEINQKRTEEANPVYSERMLAQMRASEEAYKDLLDRPHPVSRLYRPMPDMDRAAQFSPFAALTGYHQHIRSSEEQFADSEQDQLEREAWLEDLPPQD